MRRFMLVMTAALMGSFLLPADVAAGGGSIMQFPDAVAVGQVVTGSGTFGSGSQAPVSAGPWFATLDPEAGGVPEVALGPVTVTPADGMWRASLTFTVPDVPTGAYGIWVANAQGEGVGDLTGGWTVIGATLTEAQQFVRLRALEYRLEVRDRSIDRLQQREEQLTADLADRAATIDRQAERLADVGAQVALLEVELAASSDRGREPRADVAVLAGGSGRRRWSVVAAFGLGRRRAVVGRSGDADAGDGGEPFVDREPRRAGIG